MQIQNKYKVLQSALSIILVLAVIIVAFIFKDDIENYAISGYFGVFIACIASTATILLPAPGIVVVVQYAQLLNPIIVVLLGGLGTSLGEMLGYMLGKNGVQLVNIDTNKKAFNLFRKKPYLTVFLFSLIPLPLFDIVGVCAGMVKLNPIKFLLFCFCGKTIKMAFYVIFIDVFKELLLFINL